MKKIRLIATALFVATCVATLLVACNPTDPTPQKEAWIPETSTSTQSNSLYVEKVENMPSDFILGMDASCVPALEDAGVKYYDFDGNETDVYTVLRMNGINYIRVRVWNDPFDSKGRGYGGGNCDIQNAVEIGKRATANGMKLLVNFHYSDFWADPAKQMVPKAWAEMDIETKAQALYEYTRDCLQLLKDNGVDVGMVQIGNETNGAMAGEKIWMNIIHYLMKAGSKACREVFPTALVAVHFANPEKVTNYKDYAFKLDYYELDYDVFASSYYPYWHGTLENLSTLLSEIATTYDKKVMVAEVSYAYTDQDTDFYGNTIGAGGMDVKNYPMTVQGQANCVRDVVDCIVNDTAHGIGVFYWEGTWISVGTSSYEENKVLWEQYGTGWATSYAKDYDPKDAGLYYGGCAVENQAFFDAQGNPLESLKVFGLLKEGNVVEVKPDAIEDTTVICDLNGTLVLPEKVNAVMNDNTKQEVDVIWHNVDYDKMYSGGVQKYDIVGTAGGMTAHCYVSMVEFNFLQNYSFEDDTTGTGWTANALSTIDELYVENKVTDSLTGNNHYHYWASAGRTVEFTLEQEVTGLESGKYKYSISIMGGDSGVYNVYAYVKINGEEVARSPLSITSYGEWHSTTITDITYQEGDTITVGIYVYCEGSGNGAWGKIDDALLNSVSSDEE
jgi:arabinogalactan endo-1,4-beta-galactosidase